MARLVAVLDANVLYPARLRDLLLRLAIAGLFQPRWTATILAECFDSISADRPDLTAEQLDRTRHLMAVAIPDALVEGYEDLIDRCSSPSGRHRNGPVIPPTGTPFSTPPTRPRSKETRRAWPGRCWPT